MEWYSFNFMISIRFLPWFFCKGAALWCTPFPMLGIQRCSSSSTSYWWISMPRKSLLQLSSSWYTVFAPIFKWFVSECRSVIVYSIFKFLVFIRVWWSKSMMTASSSPGPSLSFLVIGYFTDYRRLRGCDDSIWRRDKKSPTTRLLPNMVGVHRTEDICHHRAMTWLLLRFSDFSDSAIRGLFNFIWCDSLAVSLSQQSGCKILS